VSAVVQLLVLDRLEGTEQLAARFDATRGVELAAERRTLDGWRLLRRIVVRPDELEAVRDAFERAIAIGEAAGR
jgi:hypothetical protein